MKSKWQTEALTEDELTLAYNYATGGLSVSRAIVGKMHRELMLLLDDEPTDEGDDKNE